MILNCCLPPRPEDTPRVRALFEQLLEVIHEAETDMAVFDLPLPPESVATDCFCSCDGYST